MARLRAIDVQKIQQALSWRRCHRAASPSWCFHRGAHPLVVSADKDASVANAGRHDRAEKSGSPTSSVTFRRTPRGIDSMIEHSSPRAKSSKNVVMNVVGIPTVLLLSLLRMRERTK